MGWRVRQRGGGGCRVRQRGGVRLESEAEGEGGWGQ